MNNIWKPHATVAAIIEDNERFLIVEELRDGQIVYNQPAGHLEADESIVDAVIREALEETAWQIEPHYLTGIYNWKHPQTGEQFLRFAFYAKQIRQFNERQLDEGIIRTLWLTRDELAKDPGKLRTPMVLDCIDDYLQGKQYPLDLLIDIR